MKSAIDSAYAVEVHSKRYRPSVDEVVAFIATVALVLGLVYGTSHREQPVPSCYQQSAGR